MKKFTCEIVVKNDNKWTAPVVTGYTEILEAETADEAEAYFEDFHSEVLEEHPDWEVRVETD